MNCCTQWDKRKSSIIEHHLASNLFLEYGTRKNYGSSPLAYVTPHYISLPVVRVLAWGHLGWVTGLIKGVMSVVPWRSTTGSLTKGYIKSSKSMRVTPRSRSSMQVRERGRDGFFEEYRTYNPILKWILESTTSSSFELAPTSNFLLLYLTEDINRELFTQWCRC